jgi:hypothetical protein
MIICKYPGCTNTTRTRGLCHGHYQAMRSMVRNGTADEADLVDRKLLDPPGKAVQAGRTHDAFKLGSPAQGQSDGEATEAAMAALLPEFIAEHAGSLASYEARTLLRRLVAADRCTACGRTSLDCSLSPCPAVVEDRAS